MYRTCSYVCQVLLCMCSFTRHTIYICCYVTILYSSHFWGPSDVYISWLSCSRSAHVVPVISLSSTFKWNCVSSLQSSSVLFMSCNWENRSQIPWRSVKYKKLIAIDNIVLLCDIFELSVHKIFISAFTAPGFRPNHIFSRFCNPLFDLAICVTTRYLSISSGSTLIAPGHYVFFYLFICRFHHTPILFRWGIQ